ncbi:PII-like signaling protein [Streptomyces umbrinus]|uniref:PII-like signaling protein n=1 Tax=Streptomyces umbrinus TaxID=67370 RepID=A0ABU0T0Z5_9ACTN|nr:DUF190 domain-containing protein [Streptomyces umbrinus]MDQ1029495.1 PII-like signaling protein [Streptomyces umbrinus]
MHDNALQVAIFVGELDAFRHRLLHIEIVTSTYEAGLADANPFPCVTGFGSPSHVRTVCPLPLSEGLPVAIVVSDGRGRYSVKEAAALDDCEVIRYVGCDAKDNR